MGGFIYVVMLRSHQSCSDLYSVSSNVRAADSSGRERFSVVTDAVFPKVHIAAQQYIRGTWVVVTSTE